MIFDKIKQKCFVDFQVDTDIVEDFCKENKNVWEPGQQSESSEGYIWIGLCMVEKWMSWMQPKFLFAKGLEENRNLKTLVLDWEINEKLVEVFHSYGFEFVSLKVSMFKNVPGFLYGVIKSIWTFLTCKTGKDLTKLSYRGREIGQYIYDNSVRTHSNIFTIRNCRNKVCLKKVLTSYWMLDTIHKIAKKYVPKMYLFDDLVYDEGMIIQYMHSQNAKILKCGVGGVYYEIPYADKPQYWPDIIGKQMEEKIAQMSEEEKEKRICESTRLIEERFKGLNGDTREAEYIFKNKLQSTGVELKRVMGIDNNKKTIVIFAHCFSENPHKCSEQVYEDSYTWLEETLKYVRDIDSVNWVVKGHPIAAIKYHEEGELEKLFKMYENENLHFFPNEYDSSLATQLADVALTVYGTVGAEYPCLGIPVIHPGKAVYAGFGYSDYVKSEKEYKEILSKIAEIEPLSKEKVECAKLVFSVLNEIYRMYTDEYDDRMNELDSMFYQDIYEGKDYYEHNRMVFEEIMNYMKDHNMKNTIYYRKGLEYREN